MNWERENPGGNLASGEDVNAPKGQPRGLLAPVVGTGLQVMASLMEADVRAGRPSWRVPGQRQTAAARAPASAGTVL